MAAKNKNRIIRNRNWLEETAFYEKHYDNAMEIDIVGIACKSFIKYLSPSFGTTEGCSDDIEVRKRRVEHLLNTKMVKNLKEKDLRVTVRILNPFSEFVRIRSEEEDNPCCSIDIIRVIEAIRCMAEDLNQAKVCKPDKRRINGSLSVHLVNKNPYFSVFRALQEDNSEEPDVMYTGFMLQGNKGNACPMIKVLNNGEERHVFSMVTCHLKSLDQGCHKLFNWQADHVVFNEYYKPFDVFLCHNSKDKSRVREIGRFLRKVGIVPWLDEWEIPPGAHWPNILSEIVNKVNCAAVFVGPNDTGPWEGIEIGTLLQRFVSTKTRVIPVILEGAEKEPDWNLFLNQFHRVDFRETVPDPLHELIRGIMSESSCIMSLP